MEYKHYDLQLNRNVLSFLNLETVGSMSKKSKSFLLKYCFPEGSEYLQQQFFQRISVGLQKARTFMLSTIRENFIIRGENPAPILNGNSSVELRNENAIIGLLQRNYTDSSQL